MTVLLRTAPLAVALMLTAPQVMAQEAADLCFSPVPPVSALDIPSRYKDDSKNRSDFDAEANAAVEAALGPIDDFTGLLSKHANAAMAAAPEDQTAIADCVLDRMAEWAQAGALSDLTSQGANLSMPSRVGAVAISYAEIRPLTTPDDRQAVVEQWLADRTMATMAFFDTDAPPKASQNNLRAWAALSAAQVGVLRDDPVIRTWAAQSVELVACTAAADGSLPNEMWRGKLALHYQIHAVGPLVMAAALLAEDHAARLAAGEEPAVPPAPPAEGASSVTGDTDLFAICDQAILRTARFAVEGTLDPTSVEAVTGDKQKFDTEKELGRAYQYAWLVPLLRFQPDADLAEFATRFEVLANSKLGGDQMLRWPDPSAQKPEAAPVD